jgi:Fuc2NAc and GlcNAc transferase
LLALAFLSSLVLTGLMRRYALAKQLLDVPNARSSHREATPRGGGLAMVVGFGLLLLAQSVLGDWDRRLAVAVLPAALLVAAVGFRDDHGHVSVRGRIFVHGVAAAWAIYWLGGGLEVALPHGSVAIGRSGQLLALLAMVWFLNLFNFMDGIDGIAAGEAVFLAFAGAWLAALSGLQDLVDALLVLGAVALGFLVWNWHPARIFMGDVGSGFLGAVLGMLAYAAVAADGALFWPWVILVAAFVTDASITLARRFLRGERWYEAHRSHAYQRAARRWGHWRVTSAVLLIDVGWLLPMALLAAGFPGAGVLVALAAYAPLVLLAFRLGAGVSEAAGR